MGTVHGEWRLLDWVPTVCFGRASWGRGRGLEEEVNAHCFRRRFEAAGEWGWVWAGACEDSGVARAGVMGLMRGGLIRKLLWKEEPEGVGSVGRKIAPEM